MLNEWLQELKYDPEFIFEGLKTHLAIQLKTIMEKKGIGKKELAERMGVSPSYVTKIFGGENISLKTVAKVLAALEEDNLYLHLLPGVDTEKYEKIHRLGIVFTKQKPKGLEALNDGKELAAAA